MLHLFTNKIIKILQFYKKEKFDIPYITTYLAFEYEPELNSALIWRIFELDWEYENLFVIKNILLKNFQIFKSFTLPSEISSLIETQFQSKSLSKTDLNDLDLYNNYLKELCYDDLKLTESQASRVIRPVKTSIIQSIKKAQIEKFTLAFSLRAYEVSSNIEKISERNFSNLIIAPCPQTSPEIFSKQFINNIYDQEIKVMTAACKFLALEYFSFPMLRAIARELYRKNCSVSSEPTEEGKNELNPLSVGFRVKRIINKPIESFVNDDLFLEMIEYEKKQYIKISINYNPDFFADMNEKFALSINGENNIFDGKVDGNNNSEKNSWRVMREETLRILVADYCIPFFEKEIKDDLKEKAEEFVIKNCANEFETLLKTRPYKKANLNNSNIKNAEDNNFINDNQSNNNKEDLFSEEDYAKVISFVYDNSKGKIYGVSVNEKGEIIENVEYEKLLIKSIYLATKEEKDDKTIEELQLKEFIFRAKPDLIVIGANDLKCKVFKELLFSIEEELKKGK